MQIPVNEKAGGPTVSASQLRTYGTGGFTLDEQEEAQGCPRLYHAKYVEGRVKEREASYELRYGSMFHQVMFLMEEKGLTPDEAMSEAMDPLLPQEAWTEMRNDLEAYMERGASPMDRFGTIAVEQELSALLYVDEEYGPIYYRGFIDWIGADLNVPGVLHVVDYKTNRFPPSTAAMRGDVQFRGYHWLVAQNAHKWVSGPVRIVTHLDAIKFRDIEMAYDDDEIDDWHSWTVAVVRKILRDDDPQPVLNPDCGFCPVRHDCPAWLGVADSAETLLEGGENLKDPARRLKWRDDANKMRLLLQKAVQSIDEEFRAQVDAEGEVQIGNRVYTREPAYRYVVDLRVLHEAAGDLFYSLVKTSKSAVEKAAAMQEDSVVGAEMLKAIERVPEGTKYVWGKKK